MTGLEWLLQVTQVKQERSTADPGRGVDGMFEHVIVLTKMDKRESKQGDHVVVQAGASRRRASGAGTIPCIPVQTANYPVTSSPCLSSLPP